jgi:FAD:protein FMN transferase
MELTRRSLLSFPRTLPPAAEGTPGFWLHLGRPAMACRFEITIPSELERHLDAAHAALESVDRLEDQLSIFRESSELSHLNRHAAARAVTVEAQLFRLLARCQELHRHTAGAFDITSTPLSRVWGFLRREGRVPTADELGEARARVGMEHVLLDADTSTVAFARQGIALNLGSIGKGYALDRVAADMERGGLPTALLTAGASSILALGAGPDGTGYLVGVRDPNDHGRRLATVRLRRGALGVSGAGEQFFTANDGQRYGHIIDPRSGWPVTGRLYVAVIAPDAARADALATAFFVGGRAVAERYLNEHAPEGVSILMIEQGSPPSGQQQRVILGDETPWSFDDAR